MKVKIKTLLKCANQISGTAKGRNVVRPLEWIAPVQLYAIQFVKGKAIFRG